MKHTKYSFISCMLFLLTVRNYSAYPLQNKTQDVDPPGRCVYFYNSGSEELKLYLKPDEYKRDPKQCIRIHCHKDLNMDLRGCPTGVGPSHCRLSKGDISRPFPYCCGELVC